MGDDWFMRVEEGKKASCFIIKSENETQKFKQPLDKISKPTQVKADGSHLTRSPAPLSDGVRNSVRGEEKKQKFFIWGGIIYIGLRNWPRAPPRYHDKACDGTLT